MKKFYRSKEGQFSVIAALLVSVILVSAVITSYTMVRHSSIQEAPEVLTAIGDINAGIESILDFTVGYYGSIIQVTGNSTYARELTSSYLSSGLVNIARSHPEWNPSFTLDSNQVSTNWFMPQSYSFGEISVTYSLGALGIEGVTYETSSALSVTMLESNFGEARINVTRDNSEPELGLTKENFYFYNYSYSDSTWELVNPSNIVVSANGIYTIPLPSGVNPDGYSVQIEDNRGIMVSAFYSQSSIESGLGIPHYIYSFDWVSTGLLDIYESLSTDTFVVELLQNGSINWLGQNLEISTRSRPIPPVPIKAFQINATINGVNQKIPFQVENWASEYMVPMGLAGNESIFKNNNMIVFLVNNEITNVTLWWNGTDNVIQTPYAWENLYFSDDVSNANHLLLSNGDLDLNVDLNGGNLVITSTVGSISSTTEFLRINGESPSYGAGTSAVIYNGVVRDILQQEPEFSGNGVPNSPNFYSQLVITLPANSKYYTYNVRTIFVDSSQYRNVTDLSVIQLSSPVGTPMTEDGTSGGYPTYSNSTGYFYDGSPTSRDHHWSQFVSGNLGVGVMFTDFNNEKLYEFDSIASSETGAIFVTDGATKVIEVNPVELTFAPFNSSLDVSWYGAVVTSDNEYIYHSGDNIGLWVMVENPPEVMLDEYDMSFDLSNDYVDNNLSNIDSSADKGSHFAFSAQKVGPDSTFDTLLEENTAGGTSSVVLIDSESFEGSWLPTGWTEDPNPNEWNMETDQSYDGTNSADFDGVGSGSSGSLVTYDLDCSDATKITIEFRFYDDQLDNNEFFVEYFDGNTWNNIDDLGQYTEGTWNLYEHEITDSQYFISDFKVRWRTNDVEGTQNEHAYVDLVTVTKTLGSDNYELDLEVQWTNADYDETNEELCIYVGSTVGEDLKVDVWTGSTWTNVFSNLNVGWNNATVSSYLTSSIFTIRFKGTTESGDVTEDFWTIDATLLHTWS